MKKTLLFAGCFIATHVFSQTTFVISTGVSDEGIIDVIQSPDGIYIAIGGYINSNGNFDTHILKFNASGQQIWSKIFSGL